MSLGTTPMGGPVPLSADEAAALALAFKALGDPVRLRLVSLIAAHDNGEACVCDLTGAFELTGPTISHHLKVLRTAGLITGERRGTWIYYRTVPDVIRHLANVLDPTTTPLASRCTPEESDRPE
ncbi:MAG: helix-turn-helix transcriptional regulator [Pseudonocardia sp.]|uniref:ArsR/SmtB family transcription factor n=1 Tax=unclassified Pseudonocardia TaxID=2619320 RepID=UPI000869E9D1|nr:MULTISPECIES: metalloregulator ArsR/SmtB family transcription factor [unclassified Pseudonocardia]MBN9111574.1 helix-turn-helix transcriptional regulator [Pseudonocardia sp.]ODU98224.1 MAG: transcriptional regulator [Pseudonocardia sp. SCN 73-27]